MSARLLEPPFPGGGVDAGLMGSGVPSGGGVNTEISLGTTLFWREGRPWGWGFRGDSSPWTMLPTRPPGGPRAGASLQGWASPGAVASCWKGWGPAGLPLASKLTGDRDLQSSRNVRSVMQFRHTGFGVRNCSHVCKVRVGDLCYTRL